MYTLDCPYYDREFESLSELIDDVLEMGMDPNYEILYNGVSTGETLWEFIVP